MQTLVIGDVHDCFHELQALPDRAGRVDRDTIISLGDWVDRGLETPQVLNFFQSCFS
jgi:predicted phosphodiesterase